MSQLNESYISEDLLERDVTSLSTTNGPTNGNSMRQTEQMNQSQFQFTSRYVKTLSSTLQLLYNKESKTPVINLWIDSNGIKLFIEEKGVFQCIVFWQRDLFEIYGFEEKDQEINLRLPLKDLLVFFESALIQTESRVDIYILETSSVLLQLRTRITTVRMKISTFSQDSYNNRVFEFSTYKGILHISATSVSLMPSFRSLEWNHMYITFETDIHGKLMISSQSPSDSITTTYSSQTFVHFECLANVTARYHLNYFRAIKKALDQSKKVIILMNSNKMLYIECTYESDDKEVSAEIAFYVCAQVSDDTIHEEEPQQPDLDQHTEEEHDHPLILKNEDELNEEQPTIIESNELYDE
ncbi:hypothetical protein ENUP19_0297G0003 [Entamoeba nuttalli]|uniref:Rad9 protein n=2 Tax=Entamoeba nuttalli TaxID=412467 RepID=K2GW05_ENTNP|nr:hypothetical protein ENU1_132490 [Entamoeba nuttalli P19]EKE39343.1 hypothetical protein ENU1_132490 [Entamoeba nuttalli P19]|eukprot:XP_008858322.1 hypothetical protein ENU1_132490 [Entamoeba nuttalli P19]